MNYSKLTRTERRKRVITKIFSMQNPNSTQNLQNNGGRGQLFYDLSSTHGIHSIFATVNLLSCIWWSCANTLLSTICLFEGTHLPPGNFLISRPFEKNSAASPFPSCTRDLSGVLLFQVPCTQDDPSPAAESLAGMESLSSSSSPCPCQYNWGSQFF